MSRVGKKPIPVPDQTKVSLNDRVITVSGPKGTLTRTIHPSVELAIEPEEIRVTIPSKTDRKTEALQGLMRSLVSNMVTGVSSGFERTLEISGIGYRAELKDQAIVLNIGYSHPVNFVLPEGIAASIEKNTVIKLTGIDKELLGQTAASVRRLRPPEPYKGKGIKYAEERVQRKAGKAGTK